MTLRRGATYRWLDYHGRLSTSIITVKDFFYSEKHLGYMCTLVDGGNYLIGIDELDQSREVGKYIEVNPKRYPKRCV